MWLGVVLVLVVVVVIVVAKVALTLAPTVAKEDNYNK